MNTQNYFYLGYLVIWFVTFSYVFSISKRRWAIIKLDISVDVIELMPASNLNWFHNKHRQNF